MADLFGFEQPDDPVYKGRPKKKTLANGYAATPGSGPDGETCGTCKYHKVKEMAKRYHKCELTKWTGGVATDIRVRSPACLKWEAK